MHGLLANYDCEVEILKPSSHDIVGFHFTPLEGSCVMPLENFTGLPVLIDVQ